MKRPVHTYIHTYIHTAYKFEWANVPFGFNYKEQTSWCVVHSYNISSACVEPSVFCSSQSLFIP